jgi:hypothetical protein
MLTLERIQMLQSDDCELTESKQLSEFGEEYDTCCNTFLTDDYDIMLQENESLLLNFVEDVENVTGFVLLIVDGGIDELWFTTSSIPYDLNVTYWRLY